MAQVSTRQLRAICHWVHPVSARKLKLQESGENQKKFQTGIFVARRGLQHRRFDHRFARSPPGLAFQVDRGDRDRCEFRYLLPASGCIDLGDLCLSQTRGGEFDRCTKR